MMQIQVSNLSTNILYNQLKDIHKRLKDLFDNLAIPVFDPFREIEISPDTRATMFEHFPVECEHFGSADAFYMAFCILNYFLKTLDYLNENKISFNGFSLKAEDIIILDSFKLFKGL